MKTDSARHKPPPLPDRPANVVDLHAHTMMSDGVLSPRELYGAMAECGLEFTAVTDHDTLAGYRELSAGIAAGEATGPALIPAVEINSVANEELLEMGVELDEGELHILGFGVDPDDEAFEAALAKQRDARRVRLMMIIDALRGLGKPIDDQIAAVLESNEALGRPHIARAMVAAGHVANVQQAFDEWIDRKGPAYVPRQGMTSRAALDCINAAGGLPVLAHYSAAPRQKELINLLLEWGLRGLEVFYRRFLDDEINELYELTTKLPLVATGGSDYHGDGATYAQWQVSTYVPRKVADKLLEAIG